MASASTLRWLAVGLLLATGLIHIVYGAYYVSGAAASSAGAAGGDYGGYYGGAATTSSAGGVSPAPVFYGMGVVYLVGVAALAANVRPRLFQRLALLYTVLLLVIWAAVGARDVIAYADKVIEVLLGITLVLLIRHKPVAPVPISQAVGQATG